MSPNEPLPILRTSRYLPPTMYSGLPRCVAIWSWSCVWGVKKSNFLHNNGAPLRHYADILACRGWRVAGQSGRSTASPSRGPRVYYPKPRTANPGLRGGFPSQGAGLRELWKTAKGRLVWGRENQWASPKPNRVKQIPTCQRQNVVVGGQSKSAISPPSRGPWPNCLSPKAADPNWGFGC